MTLLLALFVSASAWAQKSVTTITKKENITKTSTVYVGEVVVDGVAMIKYLYSDNMGRNEEVINNLLDGLQGMADDSYATLLDGVEADAEARGLALCSDAELVVAMDENWSSAQYVGTLYFSDKTVASETNSNLYDIDEGFKAALDIQVAARAEDIDTLADVEKCIVTHLDSRTETNVWYDIVDGRAIRHADATIIFDSESTTVIYTKVQLGNTSDHEFVDLGLPSGTLWATTNVGATSPHDIGLLFAWGDTEGHGTDPSDGYKFDWNNYKWAEVVGEDSYFTKYCVDSKRGLDGFSDFKYVLDLDDDAATANWGEEWRTPSLTQFKELQQYCTWEPDEVHGVPGYRVTGDNGNSIFLPETGWRIDEDYNPGGAYWARNAKPGDNGGAYQFAWDDWGSYEYGGRCNGQCVRPVVNKSIKTKYYLLGDFNGWDQDNMIPFDDNDCTSLTMTLSGEFLVKDSDGNWLGGDTIAVKYTLNGITSSVTLSSGDNKKNLNFEFSSTYMLSIQDGKLSVYGFPTGYYITGTFNEWAHELMTDNGDGTYTIQKELAPDDEFKFRDPNGNWYGGDTDNHGDKYKVNSGLCTDIPLTMGDAGSNFKIEAGNNNLYTIILTDDNGGLKLDVEGFGFIALSDNSDNIEAIEYATSNAYPTDVKLLDRTLYKDGGWNTLCLPFEVFIDGSVLGGDGVEARTLTDANFVNGTLTLTFSDPVSVLSAGVPYIIKWAKNEVNIEEPVFSSVTFSDEMHPCEFEGVITFTGTYSPVEISALGDDTKLFIGADNSVFYPNGAMTIGCQRAYFQLADGITAGDPDESSTPIKAFELNFGEENGISLINTTTPEGCWFSIDGLRHSTMPTQRGIYIQNGKKFFVK